MELEIKLFASLRKFNPELERIEVDDGITILELFDKAGIPPSEVTIKPYLRAMSDTHCRCFL